ncbi:MAG: cation diffusion facilitator family transporter [Actinobacteria bacterium]|nr:cation diffusion facilitator family transporter [Actinomycetota bacterium]
MAALTSVIAAIALTAIKIVVGMFTGSLGILAEAAHSGLDLIAAIMTLLAIRISDRPADPEHHYGHGKFENLSALFETLLLLGTCVWIIYEAVQRLFFKPVELDVSIWAFIIMAISIIVDISRSRVLYRVAKKYKSQALEADGLHFSTDIWSSSVVIIGLFGVKLSEWFPKLEFLHHADAVAALAVAMIVVLVSVRLGMRTIHTLLDTAPKGLKEMVTAEVESIEGVIDCHNVRIRHSGAKVFLDIHILVDGCKSLQEVHDFTEKIENRIEQIITDVDVTVHPEPKACSTNLKSEK